MSILDKAGQLMGGGVPGGNASPLQAVLSMVNDHPGGISGLAQSFERQGLGGRGSILDWERPKPAGQWGTGAKRTR